MMVQVKIKFWLKFLKVGWISIFVLYKVLIIDELCLQDKGNLEST